jgi:hypothetical protein
MSISYISQYDEPVVVGVTGHRRLGDENTVRSRVRFTLLMLSQRATGSARNPAALTVLSAVAEGADRLVAEEVLRLPKSNLEVVLPFARADYETDFETTESKAEFASLLKRATEVQELPEGETREAGYENAGRTIVDECAVLIAIWDGKESRGRGGTAEIVEYARKLGKEVVWIESEAPYLIHDEHARVPSVDTTDLNAFLKSKLNDDAFQEQMAKQRSWWSPADPANATELPLDELMDWILPEFVRADMLALRYQRIHQFIGELMFALPVIAVVAVTIQAFFVPQTPLIVLVELGALVGLVAAFSFSHWAHVHSRWISYRFLAERLRSSYFLAVIASSDQRGERAEVTYLDDPSDEWIRLMIAEVNSRRPPVKMTPTYVAQARDYLAQSWIHDQAQYHRKASARHGGGERLFQRSILILFILAFIAAVIHVLDGPDTIAERPNYAWVLIQLSIVVPVIGAAFHGISTQREFKRHAQRYERMAKLLDDLQTRMLAAQDANGVKQVASDVERVIRDENSDWFGVMRFHDVELIT